MDFSNLEKLRLKVDGTYLLCKEKDFSAYKLSLLSVNNNFSSSFETIRSRSGLFSSVYIDDLRKTSLVKWESPPVGYINLPLKKSAGIISRPPIRTSKLGLRPELVRLDLLSKKSSMTFLDIFQEDYSNLLNKIYPSYEAAARLLVNEDFESVALSRYSACTKIYDEVLSVEIGGSSVAWMWKNKVRFLNGMTNEFILGMSGIDIDRLKSEVLNAKGRL